MAKHVHLFIRLNAIDLDTNLFYYSLELSPHVANNVADAIEALSVALGPGVVLSYLWSGLFHPARKVRERYWIVYNSVYLRHQDAMVPFYPRLTEDPGFVDRAPLDVWV